MRQQETAAMVRALGGPITGSPRKQRLPKVGDAPAGRQRAGVRPQTVPREFLYTPYRP